ncbi:hypothetical protein I7I50_02041 [Histoplasma capsulatum G186AR]|nr:hypothetical protein I7I52_12255 [Histoplasma capsulatum]QSS71270.1 hypothetical protein I7I50_02041 [Histoplasma capsulatum G186AR]
MASRTSTRQAAVKANEALHQGARASTKKTASGKRKGKEQEEAPKTKREKAEEEKPTKIKQRKLGESKEGPTTEGHEEETESINAGLNKHQNIEGAQERDVEEPREPDKLETKRLEKKEAPKEAEPKADASGPKKEETKETEMLEAKESKQEGEVRDPVKAEQRENEAPEKSQPQKENIAEPGHKERASVPTTIETGEVDRSLPSNVLEKGIIYFFFRSKVGVEEPEGIADVARSFIVLRPLPRDVKLGQCTIGDHQNCRLLVLPKKVLPKSSRDRFMGFVEKAHTTMKTIKDSFLASERQTATRGTAYTPAATPIAEGVYAIASKGRSSHLAYYLTIPSELGEVQKNIGLRRHGSFIASVKNPEYVGPETARLPHGPEFPQKVQDEFNDLRWVPLQPTFLDYPNAQFLLIGGTHHDPEEAEKAIEELEHQNESRTYPLNYDDIIYKDLGMDSRNYPDVATTWE